MKTIWNGVIPAITTPFKDNFSIDFPFLVKHSQWMIDQGCTGIVALGSLGEGATLSFEEKCEILISLVTSVGDRVPIIAGISALSTREAVELAQAAEKIGCQGLMVLPPYVYSTDWREMKAHVAAIMEATDLSCMLYNNPPAYTTDFLPEQVAELAEEYSNLHAIKESSTDVRRVTALKALLGDRLHLGVGVDDVLVEGVQAGATFWIAGLVNAYPKESVDLFNFAMNGELENAFTLYQWFLPLLRLDTVVKFVQLIKLVQEHVGMGSTIVRPPRLKLVGDELAEAELTIKRALESRP